MRTWLLQRLSAVYMLVYLVLLVAYLLGAAPVGYEQWYGLFSHLAVNIATVLFFGALLFHAWVGVRDILMDYIHPLALRFTIWVLVSLLLAVMGIWVLMILWSVVSL